MKLLTSLLNLLLVLAVIVMIVSLSGALRKERLKVHTCKVELTETKELLNFAESRMDLMQEQLNSIPHGW